MLDPVGRGVLGDALRRGARHDRVARGSARAHDPPERVLEDVRHDGLAARLCSRAGVAHRADHSSPHQLGLLHTARGAARRRGRTDRAARRGERDAGGVPAPPGRRRRGSECASRRIVRDAAGRVLCVPEHSRNGRGREAARRPAAGNSRGRSARRNGVRGARRGLSASVLRELAREHRGGAGRDAERPRRPRRRLSGRARIVVTRRIPEPALDLLRQTGDTWVSPHDRPLTRDELLTAVDGADAIVCLLHDRIDDEVLAAAGSQLAVVANVAVGYDNIDVAACARYQVVVTNTPGVLTDATADIAFALVLMATRRPGEGERLIRAGTTWSWHMFFLLGKGLQGKTLGIVGLGQIGRATARRGRAFGMSIVYAGPRPADPAVQAEPEATDRPLDELLATSDVVSLHVPLNEETRHLIDAD